MNSSECQIVSRTLSRLRLALSRAKNIPDAADGLDQLGRVIAIKMVPQSADQHVHEIGLRVKVVVPKPLEEVELRKHAVLVAHEQLEEGEFPRRKLNPHAFSANDPIDQIDEHAC